MEFEPTPSEPFATDTTFFPLFLIILLVGACCFFHRGPIKEKFYLALGCALILGAWKQFFLSPWGEHHWLFIWVVSASYGASVIWYNRRLVSESKGGGSGAASGSTHADSTQAGR